MSIKFFTMWITNIGSYIYYEASQYTYFLKVMSLDLFSAVTWSQL